MCKVTLFLFLYLGIIYQISAQNKLQVEVLYESLCPDSLQFITQQLHPVFKELAPYIDLKLTPFGKSASLQDGAQFICQHGPQECKGNKIQSCVLNVIQEPIAQVEYVNCFMQSFKKGQKNEAEFGQTCAEAVGFDLKQLTDCFYSELGTKLQLQEEQRTLKFSPRFVPTILFNDIFDQQLQDSSLNDFRGVVCSLISKTYPQACRTSTILRL